MPKLAKAGTSRVLERRTSCKELFTTKVRSKIFPIERGGRVVTRGKKKTKGPPTGATAPKRGKGLFSAFTGGRGEQNYG